MTLHNILLITADELRGDCLGCTGNPDVRTPNIDRLAADGTLLKKHFAPFPKCVPSRCSMHTGRYPHTDGLRTIMPDNHLPEGSPNLAETLRRAGYETAVLGLNHLWEPDWFYGAGKRQNKKGAGVVDYTSFTEGPLARMATAARQYPEGVAREGAHIQALRKVDYKGLETGSKETFSDENRADQACLYLEELRDPEKPFFLQLNLSKPHPPYGIHEPYYSMYEPDSLRPFPHELPANASLPLRAQRTHRLGDAIGSDALREIQAAYYGMISFIDDLVGKVLASLEASGLKDDTLVIFTSDHGDFAGQYGINEKWDTCLQDCLLHVPFILSGPGLPRGKVRGGLSEHVDLPATLLDYLGLSRDEKWIWHGCSLLPFIKGEAPGKPAVFASGGHEAPMRARFDLPAWGERNGRRVKTTGGKQLTYRECPDAMARCKMVRTKDWKLVIRETGGNELFHLRADPDEMFNLYPNTGYEEIKSQLMLQLLEWTLRTETDRPYLAKVGA